MAVMWRQVGTEGKFSFIVGVCCIQLEMREKLELAICPAGRGEVVSLVIPTPVVMSLPYTPLGKGTLHFLGGLSGVSPHDAVHTVLGCCCEAAWWHLVLGSKCLQRWVPQGGHPSVWGWCAPLQSL